MTNEDMATGEAKTRKTSFWRFVFPETDLKKARHEAEAALTAAGFSVGRRQRGAPSAIVFGDFDVAKWRNLEESDHKILQGSLHADVYPVVAFFPSGLSEEADDALMEMNVALTRRFHSDEAAVEVPSGGGSAKAFDFPG